MGVAGSDTFKGSQGNDSINDGDGKLELMRTKELIENWYEVQINLSLQVARDFILEHLEQKMGLNTHSQIPVNA